MAAGAFLVCSLFTTGGPLDARRYGDVHVYAHYAHAMTSGRWPYRDFFDEYPPLAQPLFLFVKLLPGSFASAFTWTMAVLGALTVAVVVITLERLGANRSHTAAAAATGAASPLAAGPFLFHHYDLFAALLVGAAVLALVTRRETAGYVLLGLGVAAKVYPLAILPVALIRTWKRDRSAVARRSAAFGAAVLAAHLPFLVVAPGGVRFSYWVQLKRGLHVESLGGISLLAGDKLGLHQAVLQDQAPGGKNVLGGVAGAFATATSVVEVVAVVLVAWLLWKKGGSLVLAAAAAVAGALAFGKVFSPQYVVWLIPLVPLTGVVPCAFLLAIEGLTHVSYGRYGAAASATRAGLISQIVWVDLARDFLVVALYALLVARLSRGRWQPRRRPA
jgi:hypothetical protein